MPPRIDNEVFEWLGEQLEPPPAPPPIKNKKWMPRQTRKQRELFLAQEKYILLEGAKGGAKCRSPDALVYTDGGLVRLGSLKPAGAKTGEMTEICTPVISFSNTGMRVSEAKGFWCEEGTIAMRCEFSNGSELTGSPRHPIWTCSESPEGVTGFGYSSLEDMAILRKNGWRFWTPFVSHPKWDTSKEQLVVTKSRRTECKICGRPAVSRGLCQNHYANLVRYHGEYHPFLDDKIVTITKELAYGIGALVGDGSLNINADNRSVAFANTDQECIDRMRSSMAEIGVSVNHTNRCNHILVPAEAIKPLIRALDLAHLSYFKRIPSQIISSPKPVVASFLTGLFDTDGTVDSQGNIAFTTTSEKLGIDVQDVLSAFGILSIRKRIKTSSEAPTWTIFINGEHAFRFGKEIGFSITRKQVRITSPRVSKRCPHGFNHNSFGYPDPIRKCCKVAWKDAKISKSRAQCRRLKHLQSFGSIPSRHKVRQIIEELGSKELFTQFLVSDNWLEVTDILPCESELYDLCVPGDSSFLASGTINHNTFSVCDKLIQHCFDNRNALALILVRVQNMAVKGGSWDKLINEVLPRWKDGNYAPLNILKDGKWVSNPDAGKRIDSGLGLHVSEVKFDANHCPFIWIQNKFGGWSMITVMSCPHANQLRQRIRGVEPSMVFLDEATSCDTPEYFESVAAQLGRRPGVTGPQQFIAATNPEDPDHWVYVKWKIEPYDDETGQKDPNFRDIYFDVEDNLENLQLGYIEHLKSVYGKNATEAARMIGGQWVSAPSGESIFAEMFSPQIHVRPLDDKGTPSSTEWLLCNPKYPVIVGIDSGIVHHAFVFMQRLPVDAKMKWLIFDEVVLLRRKLSYAIIIPIVMRRLRWWFDTVGQDIPMVWISDDSAIKFFRPGAGTYDALDMERVYNANRERYKLEPIKIKGAPKFTGSVEACIRIEQTALAEEEIVISSRCRKVIAMYNRLENEKQKPGHPFDPKLATTPRRSDHLHVFSAGVYPKLAHSIQPSLLVPRTESKQTLIHVAA